MKVETSEAPNNCSTRQRILEAAGELFANQGFHNVSVREICGLAGANHAAINYYFGDKEKLYAEVLLYSSRVATERFPVDEGVGEGAPAEKKLRAYVHSTLLRVLDEGRPAWHGKLMSREMIEPTGALYELVREDAYPRSLRLKAIVRDLIGSSADEQTVFQCMMSIIGQCAFHRNAAPYVATLAPLLGWTDRSIDDLTEHITRFSLNAIRGLRAENERMKLKR